MTAAMQAADADTQNPPQLLLTVEEAAFSLRLGRTFVFEQLRLGRLKSIKAGRARRIPFDCLAEFVELLKSESDIES